MKMKPKKHGRTTSAAQSKGMYKTGGKSSAPAKAPGRTTSASQSKKMYS